MSGSQMWGDRIVTVLAIFLAVCFIGAGVFKLVAYSSAVEQFARFGYAPWFVIVTAVVEIVAAILLLIKSLRYWGASLIITTMIAAMLSHLKAGEPEEMISPFIMFIFATIVAWSGPISTEESDPALRESQPPPSTEPILVTLTKQLCGCILTVIGAYLGIICIFGNEPLFMQYPLLRWGGMVLGFGAAFGGMTLFNGPQKETDNNRTGQLRTR